MSDCEDGSDKGGEKQNTDKIRMFKLQKVLDQLDIFYQQKKLNVLQARFVFTYDVIICNVAPPVCNRMFF